MGLDRSSPPSTAITASRGEAMNTNGKDNNVSVVNARLAEAAETGETVEVILVVRGKLRAVRGADRRRWRLRVDRDHVLTFRAESVVAATPVKRNGGSLGT
jgi:hypothetical protein